MSAIAFQITGVSVVCSTVYSAVDQRKHQSSATLTFVTGINRSPVDSPHKGPVSRKMFQFDDVIMKRTNHRWCESTNHVQMIKIAPDDSSIVLAIQYEKHYGQV